MLSDSDYLLAMLAKEKVSSARGMVRQRRLAVIAEGPMRARQPRAWRTLTQFFQVLMGVFRCGRSASNTPTAATRAGREIDQVRCLAVSALALVVSIGGPVPQIIAGVQVGPVLLGMRADRGVRAALAFEQATACHIDLLIVAGKVAAAGTQFGGCLEVFDPRHISRVASRMRALPPPMAPFMDGPASTFIATFGDHLAVRLSAHRVALIWPQGLIAHIAEGSAGQGMVTYLAVVTPGCKSVPAIGYFGSTSLP